MRFVISLHLFPFLLSQPHVKNTRTKGGTTTTNYQGQNYEEYINDVACFLTPNGSIPCPARCCFDLFKEYPEYASGKHMLHRAQGFPGPRLEQGGQHTG